MYYPEELIRQIREKSDIVNVISRYVSLNRKGTVSYTHLSAGSGCGRGDRGGGC